MVLDQVSFGEHRPTAVDLLDFPNYFTKGFNAWQVIYIIYIDFSKTIDSIDCRVALSKLNLLNFVPSYQAYAVHLLPLESIQQSS